MDFLGKKNLTHKQEIAIKSEEYGKYRDITKVHIKISGWGFKNCWDISLTSEGLQFKTFILHKDSNIKDFTIEIVDLMPSAAAKFGLVTFKTFINFNIV